MGLIYKLKSKTTNKLYIGKTSMALEKRLKKHQEVYKDKDTHLYRAMKKYGWDDFESGIIEDYIPNDLLNEREIYWIQRYDSFKNGYNMTIGGDGSRLTNDDLILSLWEQGQTITDIVNNTESGKDTIRKVLNEHGITHEDILHQSKNWLRSNVDKELIKIFWEEGKTTREIRSLCGNIGQGTLLNILDELGFNSEERQKRKQVSVLQLDENDNVISSFDSIREAAKCTGVSYDGIRKAAGGVQKTSGGYRWRRKE